MNHLCTRCRAAMCPDCLEITDEYVTLLQNFKRANLLLEHHLKDLEQKLELITASRDDWERMAKLGYPEIIQKWMESL